MTESRPSQLASLDELFLSGTSTSEARLRELLDHVVGVITQVARSAPKPLPGSAAALHNVLFKRIDDLFPEHGIGMRDAWLALGDEIVRTSVNVSSPSYMAHFLSSPLIQSIVAELAVGALNQSLDSFDQGPSAAVIENALIDVLCQELDLPHGGGVFTAGASMSNLMGLLMGREHARTNGARCVVITSEQAHHSVNLAARILGIPEHNVVSVPVDSTGAMESPILENCVRSVAPPRGGIVIVVTVGTTDTGACDPVELACDLSAAHNGWVHVDAAASGALVLSRRHKEIVANLARCDSIALDFHKLGWQSVSSGCFLVREQASFEMIRHHADYLNPTGESDEDNLVWKSIQTTRRFDALKLAMSLLGLGRDGFEALVTAQQQAVEYAAQRIRQEPELEVVSSGGLHTVLFRYVGIPQCDQVDRINELLRQKLSEGGTILGRSNVGGVVSLKLQILNPRVTRTDMDVLVQQIVAIARAVAISVQGG